MSLPLQLRVGQKDGISPEAILKFFQSLPGDVAVKIHAPATDAKPECLVESNSSQVMFVGNAIKTLILCEALRQADSPDVVQTIAWQQLSLEASVWMIDSATFNPPKLSGEVSERTALEAMIMHSDNTATDMCLRLVGTDKVRGFIASAGLNSTLIPDSMRGFVAYLLGARDYLTLSWEKLHAPGLMMVNPPLNTVQTLASSADDLVSYYSRALHGNFFQNKETLNEFRRILAVGAAIYLVPLPLGVSAFAKGGSIDVSGFHAVCVSGGMFFNERWVYFCLTINWYASTDTDVDTVNAFLAATSRSLSLVKDALSA